MSSVNFVAPPGKCFCHQLAVKYFWIDWSNQWNRRKLQSLPLPKISLTSFGFNFFSYFLSVNKQRPAFLKLHHWDGCACSPLTQHPPPLFVWTTTGPTMHRSRCCTPRLLTCRRGECAPHTAAACDLTWWRWTALWISISLLPPSILNCDLMTFVSWRRPPPHPHPWHLTCACENKRIQAKEAASHWGTRDTAWWACSPFRGPSPIGCLPCHRLCRPKGAEQMADTWPSGKPCQKRGRRASEVRVCPRVSSLSCDWSTDGARGERESERKRGCHTTNAHLQKEGGEFYRKTERKLHITRDSCSETRFSQRPPTQLTNTRKWMSQTVTWFIESEYCATLPHIRCVMTPTSLHWTGINELLPKNKKNLRRVAWKERNVSSWILFCTTSTHLTSLILYHTAWPDLWEPNVVMKMFVLESNI